MLALLIYSYATGTFSSRRIERNTCEQVAVRLLCADHHPDHDSICVFRRENRALLAGSCHQVLETAARIRVLRVGDVTLALNGTKILANASKHSAVSHGHATAQMALLEDQIAQLLQKADDADSTPLDDGLSVPQEVARRLDRLEKLREATAVIEARAKERHHEEMAAFDEKQKRCGRTPQAPREGPRSKDQYNFTDPESRIMNRAERDSQRAEPLPEGQRRRALATPAPALNKATTRKLARPPTVLPIPLRLLGGFYSAAAVAGVERGSDGRAGPPVYAATGRQPHGRSVEALEKRADPPEPAPGAIYHVVSLGDRREAICRDDRDRRACSKSWAKPAGKTGWEVHVWFKDSRK